MIFYDCLYGVLEILNYTYYLMFGSDNISDIFFYSDVESQHFHLAEEEHTYSFTMSGHFFVERNC